MTVPYPDLFDPLTIGHLRLKNRIMSTSHAPAYAEDGMPKERYRRYHEEKARGGLALSMFGGSSTVSVDSPPPFGQIDLGDDRVIPWLQEFVEAVHRHDCATMIQITHMGRRTGWSSHGWLPVIAPSAVREPAHRAFPKAMDRDDIERVIGDYAAAAGRACRGGLDGCELSVLGHLAGQFWSPAVNRRTDGYGGCVANRARFTLETLEAMRERAPERFLIGMRFTIDELLDEGLHEDDALEIVRLHVDAGLVDFLNVTVGTSFDSAGLSFTVPNMSHPIAPHIDRVKRVRDAFGVPVFHANRVADLASANRAVKEGCVDMIGMTRAHIADPHLVAKLLRGEEHRVRTCVGAGYCIDRIYVGADALCLQNAATGRERTMPHVIEPSTGPRRRVVVIGAGPAGLEAARVSASRGHEVVVFEAADTPGGQIRLAARATWRRDLLGIVQWLGREVRDSRRGPASPHVRGGRRCPEREPGRRHRSDRGASGHGLRGGRGARGQPVGPSQRTDAAWRQRALVRRPRRPPGSVRCGVSGRAGRGGGAGHARPLDRVRARRHQFLGAPEAPLPCRGRPHSRTSGSCRCDRRATR